MFSKQKEDSSEEIITNDPYFNEIANEDYYELLNMLF
jgi:hypothetical protein